MAEVWVADGAMTRVGRCQETLQDLIAEAGLDS